MKAPLRVKPLTPSFTLPRVAGEETGRGHFERLELVGYHFLFFRSSSSCFKNDKSMTSAPLMLMVESSLSLAIMFSIDLTVTTGRPRMKFITGSRSVLMNDRVVTGPATTYS